MVQATPWTGHRQSLGCMLKAEYKWSKHDLKGLIQIQPEYWNTRSTSQVDNLGFVSKLLDQVLHELQRLLLESFRVSRGTSCSDLSSSRWANMAVLTVVSEKNKERSLLRTWPLVWLHTICSISVCAVALQCASLRDASETRSVTSCLLWLKLPSLLELLPACLTFCTPAFFFKKLYSL